MQKNIRTSTSRPSPVDRLNSHPGFQLPWRSIIGALLVLGLVAFETFNFDTTRYALNNLMGEVNIAGIRWATVLAIAFCAIDFAGLMRIFSPIGGEKSTETWYLTGAWLLGATMNALMTWWAVSLTLLNHNLGNEVLGRAELVNVVPVFVAVLVWLTRILFIGSFAVAGGYLFEQPPERPFRSTSGRPQKRATSSTPKTRPAPIKRPTHGRTIPSKGNDLPPFIGIRQPANLEETIDNPLPERMPPSQNPLRVQRRPPMPGRRLRQPEPMRARRP